MVQGADGDLYGTTSGGGAYVYYGTIFKFTLDGTLNVLHSFQNTDGSSPRTGLFQDTNGNFYGTTSQGGSSGYGTVFGLSVGLGPFVTTVPRVAKVAKSVMILGTGLEGSTSVSFNGTPATFKVVSGSLISTSVPTGATTGPVQVVTPSGTLTSNVNFQVLP